MAQYTILVENLDPDCPSNTYTQVITATGCTEYIVRLTLDSTTNGPFNVYVNSVLVYSNISRVELTLGVTVYLNCDSTPSFLIYASTYLPNEKTDTVYFNPATNLWGAGNGSVPEFTSSGWTTFIDRRLVNSDRIYNITQLSGITNPTTIGTQIHLEYPSGSGNTSALLVYPTTYGYISDFGLEEINNHINVQGMKPSNSNRQAIILSGNTYYVAQVTNYQGSVGQKQSWQVISNES